MITPVQYFMYSMKDSEMFFIIFHYCFTILFNVALYNKTKAPLQTVLLLRNGGEIMTNLTKQTLTLSSVSVL